MRQPIMTYSMSGESGQPPYDSPHPIRTAPEALSIPELDYTKVEMRIMAHLLTAENYRDMSLTNTQRLILQQLAAGHTLYSVELYATTLTWKPLPDNADPFLRQWVKNASVEALRSAGLIQKIKQDGVWVVHLTGTGRYMLREKKATKGYTTKKPIKVTPRFTARRSRTQDCFSTRVEYRFSETGDDPLWTPWTTISGGKDNSGNWQPATIVWYAVGPIEPGLAEEFGAAVKWAAQEAHRINDEIQKEAVTTGG